jgi:putative spermidine/putrescine transport system substrate-binding protein
LLYRSKFTLAFLLCYVVSQAAGAEVNFASWGGEYQHSQQKAWVDTWKDGQVKFLPYSGNLEDIRIQVKTGKVTWDIVDVLPDDARAGCDEGLFEELDRDMFVPAADGTPMDEDILVDVPNDCVVPATYWSYLYFYRAGSFGDDRPTTIGDFFDTERFPGARGVHIWPNALIEMALVADGVDIREVYRVMSTRAGIDRAFAKLDDIREDVVFWSRGEEPLELVRTGQVAMSIAFSGRVGAAILNGNEDFVTVADGQVLEEEWLVLVKGSPNAGEAKKFLVHASAPEQQAAQARYINYGPMRVSAFDIIRAGEPWFHNGKRVIPHMPNRPEVMARTITANPEWWAKNGLRVEERFYEWMLQY